MIPKRSPVALPLDVLERADVRDAITRHDFGQLFALARKWAGISFSKIAEECDIKPERVGTLARGQGRITSFEKIARIADVMRIPGYMLGLAPRTWEDVGITPPAERPRNGDGNVLRRQFLKSSALGLGAAFGLPALDLPRQGRRLGEDFPTLLRRRAARLRELDNVLGGGDTFSLYHAEYESTKAVIRQATYSESVGRDLVSVLSEQAQQAGWAAFDAGDHERARQLYQASHLAAVDGGDVDLAGNALAFLAYESIGKDPVAAVELATASCDSHNAPAGAVGALLHERRAWANATAGNVSETERALEMAEAALATSGQKPTPDWSAWVDRIELQIMTGRCWTELKRPLRAVPVLTAALAQFSDTHARDKALYSCWLADAYLTAGEVEEAAATAIRVLDLATGVASVRPRQQIASVIAQLEGHKGVSAATEAVEKARAYAAPSVASGMTDFRIQSK